MKKIFLLLSAALCALGLAAATNPSLVYYSYSFSNYQSSQLEDGWTSFSNTENVTPTDVAASYGFAADGPAYLVLAVDNGTGVAWSNSSYNENVPASSFLVSPAIEMTSDAAILQFKVFALSNKVGDHYYNVYVSETGNTPEDFKSLDPIYEAKLGGAGTSTSLDLKAKEINIALNGYKDKTIYLAFEDASTGVLFTGFSNINIVEYALDVINNTPTYTFETGKYEVSTKISIMTPETCTGFVAALLDKDGAVISSVENTKQIGQRYNSYNITFDTPLELSELGEVIDYSISVTPNLEGYTPSVFPYSLACGEGYPRVCVMEEPTGTACTYCARGIVFMNYFTDLYKDRFIGIAVHSNMIGPDPMMTNYMSELNAAFYCTGLPSALLNRKGTYVDPSSTTAVETALAGRSPVKMHIESVAYERETNEVTVVYTPEFDFPISGSFGACAVVREDGVHGTGSSWSQSNYLSGATESTFGPDVWPYLEWIASQPKTIPFNVMKYDHVGWGVFNDFSGASAELPERFQAGKAESYTLTFNMPENVQDWANTSIVMLFTDLSTGEILTGSVMEANEYTVGAEMIKQNPTANFRAVKKGNTLCVNAAAGATVDIYATDGTRLASYRMSADSASYTLPASHGILLVRIANGNNSRIVKVF